MIKLTTIETPSYLPQQAFLLHLDKFPYHGQLSK